MTGENIKGDWRVVDHVTKCEGLIKAGTEREALDALQSLGFYQSYGVISGEHYNNLRKIVRKRFPS